LLIIGDGWGSILNCGLGPPPPSYFAKATKDRSFEESSILKGFKRKILKKVRNVLYKSVVLD